MLSWEHIYRVLINSLGPNRSVSEKVGYAPAEDEMQMTENKFAFLDVSAAGTIHGKWSCEWKRLDEAALEYGRR